MNLGRSEDAREELKVARRVARAGHARRVCSLSTRNVGKSLHSDLDTLSLSLEFARLGAPVARLSTMHSLTVPKFDTHTLNHAQTPTDILELVILESWSRAPAFDRIRFSQNGLRFYKCPFSFE